VGKRWQKKTEKKDPVKKNHLKTGVARQKETRKNTNNASSLESAAKKMRGGTVITSRIWGGLSKEIKQGRSDLDVVVRKWVVGGGKKKKHPGNTVGEKKRE